MPNETFLNHVRQALRHASEKAGQVASTIEHNETRGVARELYLDTVLKDLLTPDLRIGTGHVVDHTGTQSPQIDLIIYRPELIPPVFFGDDKRLGSFPMESCAALISVKSKATATEIKDAMRMGLRIRELEPSPRAKAFMPMRALFAYSTDLKGDEVSRLLRCQEEIAPRGGPNRGCLLDAVCILTKGCWWWAPYYGFESVAEPDDSLTEGVQYLARLLDAMVNMRRAENTSIAPYLVDVRPLERPDPLRETRGSLSKAGWRLDRGRIKFRQQRLNVDFERPFEAAPVVIVTDGDGQPQERRDGISILHVRKEGFTAYLQDSDDRYLAWVAFDRVTDSGEPPVAR